MSSLGTQASGPKSIGRHGDKRGATPAREGDPLRILSGVSCPPTPGWYKATEMGTLAEEQR